MPSPRLFIRLIALCLLTAGCNAPYQDPRLVGVATPTDFSVVFRVRGDAKSRDPLREPSLQTVEPNRRLGVARGAAADHNRYPPFTRYLTRKEYDALFELVSNNHLIAEPTSPGGEAFDQGKTKATEMYDVEVTLFGRTNHYRTTPGESPPTVQLLTRLVALRNPQAPPSPMSAVNPAPVAPR
ncbi:MAG: hypothetical protein K8S99_01910 [Planctomycetes bacterium]|nr:hypothetical protein [Planctomycetota bacterium]